MISISIIIEKITIDIIEINNALVTAAKIIDKLTSPAERGAPTRSTILPITLPINKEEEEWENACWIICIAINPGAKNSINGTPKTLGLSLPIAKEITDKNKIEVTIGPIIVCPNTDKNLSVSFKYKV